MTAAVMADASLETPVFFPAAGETVFGIFTRPVGRPNGKAAIILPGGGVPLTTSRNRLSVRVCRTLAASGFHALRLDYHGTGESAGIAEAFRLHEPFAEDVAGAIRWVRQQGVEEILLIGSCFGARTALSAGAATEGMAGLILVSAPLRDFQMGDRGSSKRSAEWSVWRYLRAGLRPRNLKGLFDRRRRVGYGRLLRAKRRALLGRVNGSRRRGSGGVDPRRISPSFVAEVASVLERRVPILFVYGEGEDFYREFREARSGRLGKILARAGPLVDLRTIPGEVHGFTRLRVQESVLGVVGEWAVRLGSRSADGVRAG